MIDWLYALPELLVIFLSAAILAGLTQAVPFWLQRLPVFRPAEDHFDFIVRVQTTLFSMTGLVLAFTIVEAENNFRRVDQAATIEASQINNLDRLLVRYGKETERIRPYVRAYAQSVVAHEWPEMLKGEVGSHTSIAFMTLSRGVIAVDPTTVRQSILYGEMMKSLDAIAESRNTRLSSVSVALPATYWEVVLFSVLALVLVTCTIKRTAFRACLLGAQMSVLGAFVGFTFVMDQPYKGITAVRPDALVRTIASIDRRDS